MAVRPRSPKKHTVQFWAQESSDTGRCQWLSGLMSSVLPGPLGASCPCPHTDLVADFSVVLDKAGSHFSAKCLLMTALLALMP